MEMIYFYKGGKKVAEVDVTGWALAEVVALMRAARTNGRTGKYFKL